MIQTFRSGRAIPNKTDRSAFATRSFQNIDEHVGYDVITFVARVKAVIRHIDRLQRIRVFIRQRVEGLVDKIGERMILIFPGNGIPQALETHEIFVCNSALIVQVYDLKSLNERAQIVLLTPMQRVDFVYSECEAVSVPPASCSLL